MSADLKSPDQSSHSSEEAEPRSASTLVRGLAMLRAFRPADEDLTNAELARRTGLSKATVSRLSHALVQLGYLRQDTHRGTFRLGPGVLALAHAYLARADIRAIAHPIMEELATTPSVTVSLAARDHLNLVTIEAVIPDEPIHLRASVGASAPIARTAIGHAYLAGLEDLERDRLLQEIKAASKSRWPATARLIKRNTRAVQEDGYCIALGEWKEQINGVAVPIRTSGGEVFAMSCGGLAQLLPEPALRSLGQRLASARGLIESAMGAR